MQSEKTVRNLHKILQSTNIVLQIPNKFANPRIVAKYRKMFCKSEKIFCHVLLAPAVGQQQQQPKKCLSGAACNGRIFITGKVDPGHHGRFQCEVYCETTNEWQSIASLNIRPGVRPKLLSVDDQLYVLGSYMSMSKFEASDTRVECYDADKNEWVLKTEIPLRSHSNIKRVVNCYSARICKSFLSNHQLKSQNPRRFFVLSYQRKRLKTNVLSCNRKA